MLRAVERISQIHSQSGGSNTETPPQGFWMSPLLPFPLSLAVLTSVFVSPSLWLWNLDLCLEQLLPPLPGKIVSIFLGLSRLLHAPGCLCRATHCTLPSFIITARTPPVMTARTRVGSSPLKSRYCSPFFPKAACYRVGINKHIWSSIEFVSGSKERAGRTFLLARLQDLGNIYLKGWN